MSTLKSQVIEAIRLLEVILATPRSMPRMKELAKLAVPW